MGFVKTVSGQKIGRPFQGQGRLKTSKKSATFTGRVQKVNTPTGTHLQEKD
jgi:hypothetical protein